MDKNTVTGFVLILLILVVYSIYNYRVAEEQQKLQQAQTEVPEDTAISLSAEDVAPPAQTITADTLVDTIVQAGDAALTEDSLRALLRQKEYGVFFNAIEGEETIHVLENDLLRIEFTNKGGVARSAILKNYTTEDSLPLVLFDADEDEFSYRFFTGNNRTISTSELYFEAVEGAVGDGKSLTFRLNLGEGKYIEQVYSLQDESYIVDYDVNFVNLGDIIPRNTTYIQLYWKRLLRQLEGDLETAQRYSSLYYKYTGDEVEYLSESGVDEENLSTSIKWVSYKQRFFNTTLIAEEGFPEAKLRSSADPLEGAIKEYTSELVLPYSGGRDNSYSMQFYMGPNHYQTLRKLDMDLESIIPLGPGFFLFAWMKYINRFLIIPIFNFLDNFIGNYGLIIFILTLIIKLILFPLTYRSYKSSAKMKLLQPEIEELREKHKDDQQKFATEQWKLFQQAGVSPLGGCLPMLLQMPILIAMYYFFPTSIELRQEPFLWAHDLSTYDSILNLPFTIPLYGDHVSLFTILMAVSQIMYTATNPQMTGGGATAAQMKWMQYLMPIMFIGIFNKFPAALTYYYLLANLITYGQQFFIKQFIINEDELHRQIQEQKKKPVKKSGFQKRLEDLAKSQKEQQKQRTKKRK